MNATACEAVKATVIYRLNRHPGMARAVNHLHPFFVVNVATGLIVQGEYNRATAERIARTLNNHEARYDRGEVYAVVLKDQTELKGVN